MSPRNRRLASFCLLTGLAPAMVGQDYSVRRHDWLWAAGVLLCPAVLAAYLLSLGLRSGRPSGQLLFAVYGPDEVVYGAHA